MNNRLLLYSCFYFNIHFLQPLRPIRHSIRHRWHPAAVFRQPAPTNAASHCRSLLIPSESENLLFLRPNKNGGRSRQRYSPLFVTSLRHCFTASPLNRPRPHPPSPPSQNPSSPYTPSSPSQSQSTPPSPNS